MVFKSPGQMLEEQTPSLTVINGLGGERGRLILVGEPGIPFTPTENDFLSLDITELDDL